MLMRHVRYIFKILRYLESVLSLSIKVKVSKTVLYTNSYIHKCPVTVLLHRRTTPHWYFRLTGIKNPTKSTFVQAVKKYMFVRPHVLHLSFPVRGELKGFGQCNIKKPISS